MGAGFPCSTSTRQEERHRVCGLLSEDAVGLIMEDSMQGTDSTHSWRPIVLIGPTTSASEAVKWEIAETRRQEHFMFGIQINSDQTHSIPEGLPSKNVDIVGISAKSSSGCQLGRSRTDMSTYLEAIAQQIRAEVSDVEVPSGDTQALFRVYAVLCLTLGTRTTAQTSTMRGSPGCSSVISNHPSLLPVDELDKPIADSDEPFAVAIRHVAQLRMTSRGRYCRVGLPKDPDSKREFYEQYKLMVASFRGTCK